MTELLVTDARLPGRGGRFDLAIRNGRIAAIMPAGAPPSTGETLPLGGWLVVPAPTDGHVHLDKTFVGAAWRAHVPGDSIASRIAAEAAERTRIEVPMPQRARALIERLIGFGTLALRSHVDVDETVGLAHVEALLALRAEFSERIDIQLCAFPQGGIKGRVGELLDEALRSGVQVVGGLDPAGIDGDVDAHLDTVFGLAERHGARIDIHLHDGGALGADELRRIADRTRAQGMQGHVAVSHAFALGQIDAAELSLTADRLARAGVAIMTNGPGPDAMPPLHSLFQAGVLVFGGSDNIRDAWMPYGNGDLLRRAGLIGYRGNLRTDDELRRAFDIVTVNSRLALGLQPLEIAIGALADLVAVPCSDVPELIADAPAERLVLRRGEVVARRQFI